MKKYTDPRHNARRFALATFFCNEYLEESIQNCELLAIEQLEITPENFDKNLKEKLFEGILKHTKEIDAIVTECAPDWPIDKISRVDLIILRIAILEMLFSRDVPDKVVIDEAVELAKEFGGDSSSKFVNGVLGTVVEIKHNTQKEE